MKKQPVLQNGVMSVLLVAVLFGTGCASMNNTERGALGGGIFGAAAGTAIGAATGKPALGAAIGGLAGATGGALIGNEADKDDQARRDIAHAAALSDAQAQSQRMGIADVIALSQANHSDQVIINQIRRTRSGFNLTLSDLDMLKNSGVSQAVIAEMQASPPPPQGRVVVREPRPTTVIYESPAPVFVRPAPVYVVGPSRPYCYGSIYYRR